MGLAVEKGFEVHQLDFVSSYLNGKIEEELYMEVSDHLPSILNKAELNRIPKNKIFKLRKALYELKQSGRQWFTKFDEKLKSMYFKQLGADNYVYTFVYTQNGSDITIIVIYVEDIIAASNIEKMKHIKKHLSSFEMKDLGKIHHCFRIRFTQTNNSIIMDQKRYTKKYSTNSTWQSARQ